MAEEVGVAFVRLVPSMRGFGSEAQRALNDSLTGPARRAGEDAGREAADGFSGALRRGADDAGQDAGRQAGDSLGDALRRGAADAGQEAGRDAGEGLAAGAEGPAADAGQTTAGRFGQAFRTGVAAAAVAAGVVLIHGFTQALDEGRITARLGAQLGLSAEDAKHYGHLAGQLYADAVVEDFQAGADAIRAVWSAGLIPADATDQDIKQIATGVADLANTFEFDLGEAATAVGQLIKNGMAPDARTGLDLLAEGLKGTDARAEDALETITEYGAQFKLLGLDGAEAIGLIRQGLQAGAMDTDKIADAFKEFQLRAVTDAEPVQEAFKALGLDGKQMGADIGAGGDRARDALDRVLDELRDMPQSAERAMIVQELFGGPGEDLGAALFALDVDKAAKSLDGMSGSAERMGETLRDNAGTRVTQFTRSIEHGFVEFLGGRVIPAAEDFRTFMVEEFGGVWAEAGKGADSLPDQIVAALQILVDKAWEKAKEVGPKLIDAIVEAGREFATYVMENPGQVFKAAALGAALVAALAALPITVGAALLSAATAMIWTFVGGMISALVEKVPEWWNALGEWVEARADEAGLLFDILGVAISDWFSSLWDEYIGGPVSRTWHSWMATVHALPERTYDALSDLGSRLRRRASDAWEDFKDAAARKGREIVDWAGRLPDRIVAPFSNADGWLYGAGRSIIQGLVDGLWSMVGYLGDTMGSIADWATSFWPFSPAERGPLRSKPPELWGANVGRLMAEGLRSSVGDITAASELAAAGAIAPADAGVAVRPLAAAPAGTRVVIDGTNLPRPLLEWLRGAIRTEGSGDVQAYLGQTPQWG